LQQQLKYLNTYRKANLPPSEPEDYLGDILKGLKTCALCAKHLGLTCTIHFLITNIFSVEIYLSTRLKIVTDTRLRRWNYVACFEV